MTRIGNWVVVVVVAAGLCCGCFWAANLRWQWSGSGPVWAYRLTDLPELRKGAWVVVCLDGVPAKMARERGYLPETRDCPSRVQPILKQVWALEGETVNLGELAEPSGVDRMGRALPAWRDGTVGRGQVWLRSIDDGPNTWDSKFYGPVPEEWIRWGAEPVRWAWLGDLLEGSEAG